jgi:type IV pilus assembly protein PilO
MPVAMRTGLEGKPWYVGLTVGVLVGGAIYGLAYWQWLTPMKDDIERQEHRLADLQVKIQEGRAAKAELPKFREEVRQLELELDKLLRILPARRNTPDLLRRIRALAEQGDFNLKSFTPGNLTDKEFFSEWPIKVDLDGTYHNLAMLFDRIGRFSRIINIEDLAISAIPPNKNNNQRTLSATFTAKTFVYKEPDLSAPAAGAPGAPGAGAPAARPGVPPAAAEGPASRIRSGSKPSSGGD